MMYDFSYLSKNFSKIQWYDRTFFLIYRYFTGKFRFDSIFQSVDLLSLLRNCEIVLTDRKWLGWDK